MLWTLDASLEWVVVVFLMRQWFDDTSLRREYQDLGVIMLHSLTGIILVCIGRMWWFVNVDWDSVSGLNWEYAMQILCRLKKKPVLTDSHTCTVSVYQQYERALEHKATEAHLCYAWDPTDCHSYIFPACHYLMSADSSPLCCCILPQHQCAPLSRYALTWKGFPRRIIFCSEMIGWPYLLIDVTHQEFLLPEETPILYLRIIQLW